MRRLLALLLIVCSVSAYDPSGNDNLMRSERTVFVTVDADTECAIVQDREVKDYCQGSCSVQIMDADFVVYCTGYEPELVSIEDGPPYAVSMMPVERSFTYYVQGRVQNEWGVPIKSLVSTFFGDHEATAISDNSGYFSIDVPAGAYLRVMAPAHDDHVRASPITDYLNVGTLTLDALDSDKFRTYGLADYCSKTMCSCEDYGLEDCVFSSTYTCIREDDCCPSEGNCIEMNGQFRRVDARLSVDPTELAINPGESDTAQVVVRSNVNGTYSLVAQSVNFPVSLSSSQYAISSGIPSTGTITVSYPSSTQVKSDTVNVKLKYGSVVLDEKDLVVGILTPDADVEAKSCTGADELDCIFRVSNVGSFPIDSVALDIAGSEANLNLTIAPNDYVYYKMTGLLPFSKVRFAYSTRGRVWSEEKTLYVTPETEQEQEPNVLEVLSEVFKSIFG